LVSGGGARAVTGVLVSGGGMRAAVVALATSRSKLKSEKYELATGLDDAEA
jgi:hypothetical protein